MMPDKQPPQQPTPDNEIDLTPDDEHALDSAWAAITDAEIEASIRWLEEIAHEDDDTKEQPNGRQQQQPQ